MIRTRNLLLYLFILPTLRILANQSLVQVSSQWDSTYLCSRYDWHFVGEHRTEVSVGLLLRREHVSQEGGGGRRGCSSSASLVTTQTLAEVVRQLIMALSRGEWKVSKHNNGESVVYLNVCIWKRKYSFWKSLKRHSWSCYNLWL